MTITVAYWSITNLVQCFPDKFEQVIVGKLDNSIVAESVEVEVIMSELVDQIQFRFIQRVVHVSQLI